MRHQKVLLTLLLGGAVILITSRLALPSAVVWYVNRTLDRIPEYDASIDDVDLALLRGAYVIYGVRLNKVGARVPLPLLHAEHVDLSVDWRALLEGKFVGRIALRRGSLNFVNGRTQEEQQLFVQSEWLQAVKDLLPLRINHFAISNFEIRYRDPYAAPPVDVTITNARVEGYNFSNTRRPSEGRQATIYGMGLVEQRAPLLVRATVAPSEQRPTFELNASLERLPLIQLNDLFKAYGDFDVEKGSGDFYLWIDSQRGHVRGTLKPLMYDVEVFSPQAETDSTLDQLWESLVGAVAGIFENQEKEQIGSIIPFEGEDEKLRASTWTALVEMIRNAFIKALQPGLDPEEKERE